MKKSLLIVLSLMMMSGFATERSIVKTAQISALSQAQLTFAHLGHSLKLQIISTTQVQNQVFVEISVGTIRRPDRLRNCFIATFNNNGTDYIANLQQKWDESCP